MNEKDLSDLEELASLLDERNKINQKIASIIDRPALPGHIGEYIASKIFDINLMESASYKGIDGFFTEGPLKGKSVNIKIYTKQERMLDISTDNPADYYLVLTGPRSLPTTSRGTVIP